MDAILAVGKGDVEKGIEHMSKWANKGNSSALFILGNLFFELGNPKEAESLLTKASELNHPIAMKFLATGYFKGVLGKKDYKKARYWFKKSAKYRNINSMIYLGIIYRDGLGVDKNFKTSYMWFTIAGILKDSSPGAKEPEDFAKEIESQLSQSEVDNAIHLANKWLDENPKTKVDIPSIPGPENFNQ